MRVESPPRCLPLSSLPLSRPLRALQPLILLLLPPPPLLLELLETVWFHLNVLNLNRERVPTDRPKEDL